MSTLVSHICSELRLVLISYGFAFQRGDKTNLFPVVLLGEMLVKFLEMPNQRTAAPTLTRRCHRLV
jgi:hypothetical protein